MATVETVLHGLVVNTNQGGLGFCSVTLLRGERTTLVDVAHFGRREPLLTRLAALGLRPEDIDRVVLTHAHWDHCLNLYMFPNAEVMLLAPELEYLAEPHPQDWATPAWTLDAIGRARVVPVRDGDEIEAGVRVLATPGHSPGSLTLLVQTPEGVTGLCGDALPTMVSTRTLMPRIVFWDVDEAHASARRIVDSCQVFIPGHDRPFRAEGGGYRYIEPTSLEVMFAPRDEDGRLLGSFRDDPLPEAPMIVPSARRSAGAGADG